MSVKISTIIDEKLWREFKKHAQENHQSLSHLMNEALREFLRKRRIRPEFLKHIENSVNENDRLGAWLAK